MLFAKGRICAFPRGENTSIILFNTQCIEFVIFYECEKSLKFKIKKDTCCDTISPSH